MRIIATLLVCALSLGYDVGAVAKHGADTGNYSGRFGRARSRRRR